MINLLQDFTRGLRRLFTRLRSEKNVDCCAGYGDPLSHPAVQKMTLRELADLPFDRTQITD